jgi:hypothetical protein
MSTQNKGKQMQLSHNLVIKHIDVEVVGDDNNFIILNLHDIYKQIEEQVQCVLDAAALADKLKA